MQRSPYKQQGINGAPLIQHWQGYLFQQTVDGKSSIAHTINGLINNYLKKWETFKDFYSIVYRYGRTKSTVAETLRGSKPS
jgi:hypothetical protein